jgi:pleiotropic regulator 1
MFASASPDNIKQWKCPDGKFIQNLPGHNAIINCLAVNPEGVLVSGADNGTLHCWDWRTGYNFQRLQVCYIFPLKTESKFSFAHNLIRIA